MSFAKPQTPTKNRSNIQPFSPIKSEPMSNTGDGCNDPLICQSSSINVLEEVNLLLHLETIIRNKENEIFLRQKVEEAYKLFEERRHKYFSLVGKYAALVKLACTRKVLLRNDLMDLRTESARTDAETIKMKLSSDNATDYICTKELDKFKEMLNMGKYENIPIKRSELVDLQSAIDGIQCPIEAIEMSLEKCITHGLDYFTDILDMSNYPKISKKNDQNNIKHK